MLETENYWKHKINELAKLKKDSNNEDVKRWEKEVLEPWNKKTNITGLLCMLIGYTHGSHACMHGVCAHFGTYACTHI